MQQSEKYDKLICPKGEKMSSSFFLYVCIVSIVRWLCNGLAIATLVQNLMEKESNER